MTRRSRRRRRILTILAAGVLGWGLLALLGLAGLWTTLLVLVVTIGLVARNEAAGKRRPVRYAVISVPAEEPEEQADLPGYRPSRPNAVSEEYNALPGFWNSPPPTSGHRGRSLPRREAAGEGEAASRMPPPVPPPLFGRPGSRFLLAGDTPGRLAETAADEVAAAAAAGVVVEADDQGTDTEPVNEEPASPVSADAQVAGVEVVDTQNADAEPTAAEIVDVETEDAGTEDAEVEDAATEDMGIDVLETDDAATDGAEGDNLAPADEPLAAVMAAGAEAAGTEEVDAEAPAYQLPPLDMLPLPTAGRTITDDEILERASLLERTLRSFGVEARVVDFSLGPAVTRYELQPGPGVRVNKFTSLVDDLALALAAEDVRIEAPIPGKSAVGIEVPNKERMPVPLREVLESPEFRGSSFKLPVAFGKDSAGNPVVGDLTRMPHLLIAGSTGSGKSVCMNSIICSLLFRARPDEVKMLMIDPKVVELSIYNGIPHLTAPVITDARRAAGYLKGAVKEMEARYELFAAAGVRNIGQYNQTSAKPLPYVVIFIDELADLMMVAPADVEDSICRLAQMARACGMHLVIATQSPRVDVITGLIKANVPSRIAFAVSSQVDSRVILDCAGAERLLGRGDMLYHPSGLPKPVRAQGAFIDEEAVERLVRFVRAQGEPVYTAEEVEVETSPRRGGRSPGEEGAPASAVDAILPQAARIVIEHGQASVSILQRRLRCNYTKATRLIDLLEERGFIGPYQGSKPREVLISMAQWQELFGKKEQS